MVINELELLMFFFFVKMYIGVIRYLKIGKKNLKWINVCFKCKVSESK